MFDSPPRLGKGIAVPLRDTLDANVGALAELPPLLDFVDLRRSAHSILHLLVVCNLIVSSTVKAVGAFHPPPLKIVVAPHALPQQMGSVGVLAEGAHKVEGLDLALDLALALVLAIVKLTTLILPVPLSQPWTSWPLSWEVGGDRLPLPLPSMSTYIAGIVVRHVVRCGLPEGALQLHDIRKMATEH